MDRGERCEKEQDNRGPFPSGLPHANMQAPLYPAMNYHQQAPPAAPNPFMYTHPSYQPWGQPPHYGPHVPPPRLNPYSVGYPPTYPYSGMDYSGVGARQVPYTYTIPPPSRVLEASPPLSLTAPPGHVFIDEPAIAGDFNRGGTDIQEDQSRLVAPIPFLAPPAPLPSYGYGVPLDAGANLRGTPRDPSPVVTNSTCTDSKGDHADELMHGGSVDPPSSLKGTLGVSKPRRKRRLSHRCLHCPYQTDRISNLQSHARIHSGEKPFACKLDGCSYSSTQLSNLRAHLQRHQRRAAKTRGSTSIPISNHSHADTEF